MDLFLDGVDYLVDASPLVLVLGAALDYTEALKDIDDVINASALDSELLGALVKVEETALRCTIEEEEAATELAETLLLTIVRRAFHSVVILVACRLGLEWVSIGVQGHLRRRDELVGHVAGPIHRSSHQLILYMRLVRQLNAGLPDRVERSIQGISR